VRQTELGADPGLFRSLRIMFTSAPTRLAEIRISFMNEIFVRERRCGILCQFRNSVRP